MNYSLLFRLLSYLFLVLTGTFLLSLGIGILHGEGEINQTPIRGFLFSSSIAILLTLVFYFLGREARIRFFRKEALALIGSAWLLASLTGSLPYLLIHPEATFADALFESASGFTTTGASVFTGFETWPRSLLFFRCITQWIGGLGVVVFFVAVLGSLGAGGKMLFTNESSGTSTEIDTGHFQSGVLQILYFYLSLSLLCCLTLRFFGMSWYDAVCHTFTTISTGGFSTNSLSIEGFHNPAIEWSMIFYMLLGATSFIFIIRILRGNFTQFHRNNEVQAYFVILVLATAIITILRIEATETFAFGENLRTAAFQVVSIMTTSGFNSDNFNAWQTPSKMILLGLMLVGGCTSSTAGGVKVARVVILYYVIRQNIELAYRPHVIRPIKINGKTLSLQARDSVINFILLAGAILVISTIGISLLEHSETVETAFSIVYSTLFNIGPGLGQVGPDSNYGFLKEPTKVLLSLLMIMGRLEFYAILVLFSPSLWRKFT